ncbi:hypothetical protein E2C01_070601 [Portunus trituberculatus]|uniref:Uncharacterized protein n=1 Tax=Portunus trituberculatus TaxID=210409 RepID=A0A5B7I5V4_PORTR|nr:hypothetical protein [Portunus trituberculatus]
MDPAACLKTLARCPVAADPSSLTAAIIERDASVICIMTMRTGFCTTTTTSITITTTSVARSSSTTITTTTTYYLYYLYYYYYYYYYYSH